MAGDLVLLQFGERGEAERGRAPQETVQPLSCLLWRRSSVIFPCMKMLLVILVIQGLNLALLGY